MIVTAFRVLLALGAALIFAMSTPAVAQSHYLNFNGIPLNCTTANGRPVQIFTSPSAARFASQHGGGYALNSPRYGPLILLDLRLLNRIPYRAALLVFYHECAHLALPFGVGLGSASQERNADCFAIRALRDHGVIRTWGDFDSAVSYAASMRHSLTNSRIEAMARCVSG